MDDCLKFFSVFPSTPVVSKFFDTLNCSLGGDQRNVETFEEPSMRRLFGSVCNLHEIKHVYASVKDEMPNTRMFAEQGIKHLTAYVLGSFPELYDDLELEEELAVKLLRLFFRSAGDSVFCIHCLTRFKVQVHLKKGKFCEFCGGWWLLESLKETHKFTSEISAEADTEGSENEDGILQVMKTSLIPYENEVLIRVPLILLPPRLDVDDKICNVCHETLDEVSMLVKGNECPPMNNDHFIHSRCSKRWLLTQVIENHIQYPTCPGHECPLPFQRFLNYTDYRSLQQLWWVAAMSRQAKLTYGQLEEGDDHLDKYLEQENEDDDEYGSL